MSKLPENVQMLKEIEVLCSPGKDSIIFCVRYLPEKLVEKLDKKFRADVREVLIDYTAEAMSNVETPRSN